MVLSKPLFNFTMWYFNNLFNHPVLTKAITSCIVATSGKLVSELIEGKKTINQKGVFAYALFGLLFGGTCPHYFYQFVERIVTDETKFGVFKKLILERLIYTPIYQAFILYTLARFEGKNHDRALGQLFVLYVPTLMAAWKYLTLVQILNFTVVPPMLRVLLLNVVGFLYIVYISRKRQQAKSKSKKSE
ncbi:PXMP2/4 family protein 3 [Onthophagus taurus]|uniref:PXMP2/4 family protein 3 n=1 Tax=Onthophagus taurus TaxID=166361 RepID=UPI000C208411|nr:PXMP2/4 family protein 3 [Onthophagus taurus]XP_022917499.1 PXMP2/4 family protein 3 [Onthophagus taurus]